MRRVWSRGRGLPRAAAALVACSALAACSGTATPPTPSPSPSASGPTRITFVVYGPAPVLAAYSKIASDFTDAHPRTTVKVEPYATHAQALAAVRRDTAAGKAPDVFQADSDDITSLVADKDVMRLDELLTQRQVDFGDGYSRTGLEAFSSDAALQCMPTEVSPLVVYYNTRLIDLTQAAEVGKRPVTQDTGWTLDDFTRVAALAQRPGIRGFYIAPEVRQVAPFVWSGGGQLADNNEAPTTLTLSQDSSQTALTQLLLATRNPQLTLTQAQVEQRSPLARFKAGRLGMILGYRDLLPTLRQQEGLNFDVMPLPRLGSSETDTEIQGLCLSQASQHDQAAADFITYAISDASQALLSTTGYVVPSNLNVLNSDDFAQRGQRPLHPEVFEKEIRHAQPLPASVHWAEVASAADATLEQLFYDPGTATTAARLAALDERSRLIFNPDATPSPTPTPTDSAGPPS